MENGYPEDRIETDVKFFKEYGVAPPMLQEFCEAGPRTAMKEMT